MDFLLSGVALCDAFQDVLRQGQEKEFARHLQITAGQKTDKASIMFQLTESAFRLNGSIHPQNLPFFCRNALQRCLAEVHKFSANHNFLLLLRVFRLTALRSERTAFTILTSIPGYRLFSPILAMFCERTDAGQNTFIFTNVVIAGLIVGHVLASANLRFELSRFAAFIIIWFDIRSDILLSQMPVVFQRQIKTLRLCT